MPKDAMIDNQRPITTWTDPSKESARILLWLGLLSEEEKTKLGIIETDKPFSEIKAEVLEHLTKNPNTP
jgi:hypothetical protein